MDEVQIMKSQAFKITIVSDLGQILVQKYLIIKNTNT